FEVIQINTQNLEVSGQFIYLMVVSFTVGIIIATPYILWQLWNFFEPALKPSERKYTTGIVFATSALFMTGVCFGYFVLSPLCINFFVHFSLSDQIINQFTLKSFVSFVTTLTLASGLIFELPLLIYTLSKLGLVTSTFLKKYRKHSVIVILIISSVITPPDVMSQILLTIPVYFLYEVGIIIAKRVETNAQIKLEEYES
ncbi:MAG: sec-independent protein translocase protein TatC, partial [Bacteroidia bacterium]